MVEVQQRPSVIENPQHRQMGMVGPERPGEIGNAATREEISLSAELEDLLIRRASASRESSIWWNER
jgi:hypothetical protein